ncbi:MAG TPA: flagellar biosynthetic protein FliQ [Candidatus Binataceae bacterium]|jgi:flagellar biosynthetic protein FliQ|nr:flagellar biosynthetic protein FliQ [Candidatus Binataceae bacterium]
MTPAIAADMFRYSLQVAVRVAAPLLLALTVTALVLAVLQAATQINDSSISFTPKLAIALGVVWMTAAWFDSTLAAFLAKVLIAIPQVVAR